MGPSRNLQKNGYRAVTSQRRGKEKSEKEWRGGVSDLWRHTLHRLIGSWGVAIERDMKKEVDRRL